MSLGFTSIQALVDADPALRRQGVAAAYRACCELELAALKPGNVHVHAGGHGMTVADFRRSALASAEPLTAPGQRLGARILGAVAATRTAVGCNTNLGILLLCGPLVQAALDPAASGDLRERLRQTLEDADRADTRAIFDAIRLAAPAGLGEAPAHDVRDEATAAPVAVMRAAASRDLIARQYATGYADLFDHSLALLRALERRWGDPVWATAGVYLDLLARFPDSHVARKLGHASAQRLSQRVAPFAAELLATDRPASRAGDLSRLDRELKDEGINPGTSADLTVATLLIRRLTPLCHPIEHAADGNHVPHSPPGRPAAGVSP